MSMVIGVGVAIGSLLFLVAIGALGRAAQLQAALKAAHEKHDRLSEDHSELQLRASLDAHHQQLVPPEPIQLLERKPWPAPNENPYSAPPDPDADRVAELEGQLAQALEAQSEREQAQLARIMVLEGQVETIPRLEQKLRLTEDRLASAKRAVARTEGLYRDARQRGRSLGPQDVYEMAVAKLNAMSERDQTHWVFGGPPATASKPGFFDRAVDKLMAMSPEDQDHWLRTGILPAETPAVAIAMHPDPRHDYLWGPSSIDEARDNLANALFPCPDAALRIEQLITAKLQGMPRRGDR